MLVLACHYRPQEEYHATHTISCTHVRLLYVLTPSAPSRLDPSSPSFSFFCQHLSRQSTRRSSAGGWRRSAGVSARCRGRLSSSCRSDTSYRSAAKSYRSRRTKSACHVVICRVTTLLSPHAFFCPCGGSAPIACNRCSFILFSLFTAPKTPVTLPPLHTSSPPPPGFASCFPTSFSSPPPHLPSPFVFACRQRLYTKTHDRLVELQKEREVQRVQEVQQSRFNVANKLAQSIRAADDKVRPHTA